MKYLGCKKVTNLIYTREFESDEVLELLLVAKNDKKAYTWTISNFKRNGKEHFTLLLCYYEE